MRIAGQDLVDRIGGGAELVEGRGASIDLTGYSFSDDPESADTHAPGTVLLAVGVPDNQVEAALQDAAERRFAAVVIRGSRRAFPPSTSAAARLWSRFRRHRRGHRSCAPSRA